MNITITGPRSIGKSTISKLVAKNLSLKYISSDELGEKAMKKQGGLDKAIKSGELLKELVAKGYGLIKNVYNKKDNFVFDLSAGSISSTKIPEASEEVRELAKEKSFVIGLLPSENEEESINFLFEREKNREHFQDIDSEELKAKVQNDFRKLPSIFNSFCNSIVYTEGKTSEEIAEDISKIFYL